ncbi:MAG: BatD family protein [Bacteroidales bacterium]|nr:BatD family protein [Bacteroidales bacterium]
MKRLVLFLVILFSAFSLTKAADVKFTAAAPNAVVKGEQFRLVFSINADARDLRVPEIPDFQVLMGPSKSSYSSMQVINGSVSTEVSTSFTYILMADKEGTFNVQAATATIGGKKYTSNALTIKVLPPDKASQANSQQQQSQRATRNSGGSSSETSGNISSDNLFARLNLSTHKVYEQEYVVATIKLYSRYDVGLENFKLPEFDGFLTEDIPIVDPQWTIENVNGVNYRTVLLKKALLFPQRTGNLKIGSCKFNLVVRIRSKQQSQNFFDDFFETYQDVKKILTTAPTSVDVTPLPSVKPASFTGAVGSFDVKSSISTRHLKANEAVTVKLNITGNGNLKLLKNPTIAFPADFEAYDPKVNNNFKTTLAGVVGTKTIEYLAIPRYPGKFTIPGVAFTYFDLKSKSYKTIQTESYQLQVDKGVGGTSPQVVSDFTNKESVKLLGQDIRFIRTSPFQLEKKTTYLFGTSIYWMSFWLPLLLFIILFIIFRKKARENANLALMRTKKANKVATKRLKQANKYLQSKNQDAFYDEMLKAVWGYLSDKLSIPVSELTKDNIAMELAKYGVSEELVNQFREILDTCEFARYAPAQSSDAMHQTYDRTVEAIGIMEKIVNK